ncbi:DsbA family protein [soil metagenome]
MTNHKQMPFALSESSRLTSPPDHVLGARGFAVVLVEYGDYACAACSEAEPATRLLVATYGNRLTFAYRHFPLIGVHPYAERAAEAAEAAAAQGQFWEMHRLLSTHWQHLDASTLGCCALTLGLDMPRFYEAMDDRRYRQRVEAQRESGERLGVRGSPAFFLNGEVVDVSFGLEHLEVAVRNALNLP